jgi:hypothetical protein
MKQTFNFVIIFIVAVILFPQETSACTSDILTGKITADGRPLLWKHRDTDDENNRMAFFFFF